MARLTLNNPTASALLLKFPFVISLLFSILNCTAQVEPLSVDTFRIRKFDNKNRGNSKLKGYIVNNKKSDCDRLPEYKGGDLELYNFIFDNLNVPPNVLNFKQDGKRMSTSVQVIFTIGKTGKISKAKVIRSTNEFYGRLLTSVVLDREAKRVIELMPNWIPAIIKGRKAEVQWILPIYCR